MNTALEPSFGRPLDGLRLILTRAAHQARDWDEAFREAGAVVSHLPLIEVVPTSPSELAPTIWQINTFDFLIFTSANAVDAFLPHVNRPLPEELQIATVGPATTRAVESLGVAVAVEARRTQAEGLVELLKRQIQGRRVLVPQADDARPTLVDGLRAAGAEVEAVIAYRKRTPPDAARNLAAIPRDRPLWITLTSPRIARQFLSLENPSTDHGRIRTVAIGPVTGDALRQAGREPDAEANAPTVEAMIEAIRQAR